MYSNQWVTEHVDEYINYQHNKATTNRSASAPREVVAWKSRANEELNLKKFSSSAKDYTLGGTP